MSNPRATKSTGSVNTSRRWPNQWLIVLAVLICAAIGLVTAGRALFVARQTDSTATDNSTSPRNSEDASATPSKRQPQDATAPAAKELIVDDDGQTPWVSPTDGPPLDLKYLSPGAQIIVALRPAALAAHPEGEKVLDALGPIGVRGGKFLETALLHPAGVEQVVIGCRAMSNGNWETTLVARLSGGATDSEHLAAALPAAAQKSHNGQSYWLANDRAYYLPRGDDNKLLVVASEHSIADVIDLSGDPPPLRRDIERLISHTDADRHVTIIVAPNSLFSEGRSMFAGEMTRLREPLFWFLGDELSAAALSLHWYDNFFVELIVTPTLDTSPERAARILAERVAQVPDKLENYVVGLSAQPYGGHVVARFPAMVRTLAAYTRSGFDKDHAVLRCYLPAIAGHNLLMGAELTLAEAPGAARTVAEATAPSNSPPVKAESVRERLERPTSLRFARDTLEAALEQLSKDIGAEIIIRGPDLQAEGITKNQSFGIDLENKPAEDILVEILRLANPDKTATSPADVRQKLVYVLAPSGQGGAEQVIVTTRAAATQRADELPPVFKSVQP